MRRSIYFLAAVLSMCTAARAQAQSWNLWTQCTPGALRSCASTEIGVTTSTDLWGLPVTVLLVRVANLQGLFGHESEARGLSGMTINGLGSTGGDAGVVSHYASQGNVTTEAFLDFPSATSGASGDPQVSWRFDYASKLYGCDVPDGLWGWELMYDQTCNGFITYAVPLRGQLQMASQPPTVSYQWHAWENGERVSTSCTTGVDCAMVTPEPVTSILMGTGLAGLAGLRALRRRRRKSSDA